MSIEALRWALEVGERHGLEPTTRHILLILGNRADEQGYLYPSINWISKRTGLANSTIRQHMKDLEHGGLLKRHQRHAESGGRTSDDIQLALDQPGLDLTPPAERRRPPSGQGEGAPPVGVTTPPPATGANTQGLKQEEKPRPKGDKAPSGVAELWKIYTEGVEREHKAKPSTSARNNGMLGQVLARVGLEPAKAVVAYYLKHRDPWYAKQLHDLRFLVRDCEKFWLEIQQRAGTNGTGVVPKKAVVNLVLEDGLERWLDDYPVGDPLVIAKEARAGYSRMIAGRKARGIKVRIGEQVSTYTIEELRA